MGKKSKRVNKRHFPANEEVDIHTGRTPKCYRKKACEFHNVDRSAALPSGQKIALLNLGKAQDHHIVPVSVLIAYRGDRATRPVYEGYIRYIDAMYRGQDYCANNANNLLWLPTKATYAQNSTSPSSPVFDLNLPCHTWGHPAYTKEVLEQAKLLIWNPIKDHYSKGKKCPEADVVSIEFTNLQTEFREKLDLRARRPDGEGGTRHAIQNAGQTENWWYPFCMAKDEEASAEPAFAFAMSANVPKALLRVM
jgi:hypothetical protein